MRYLDWLLNPVTFYSGASLCLLVSLTLFLNIKIELARLRADLDDREDTRDADNPETRKLRMEVEKLQESVSRMEEERSSPPAPAAVDKRAQVIRMHRRGEPVSSIAAALQTAPNEIALLLKLHSMSQRETKVG